jgi:hypothetical protein
MGPMNTMFATTIAAVSLALPMALISFGAPAAQEDSNCVSARQAQQWVESGEVMQLRDAAERAGVSSKYIGDARLCGPDGSRHWVVSVINESGDSKRISLNAQGN